MIKYNAYHNEINPYMTFVIENEEKTKFFVAMKLIIHKW